MPSSSRHALTAFLLLLLTTPLACQGQDRVPVPDGMVYVGSSRGEVYYWVECESWRSLAPANLRWYATAEQAEAAGLRPSQARGCAGPERTAGAGPHQTGICTVERIVDGDTLVCEEAAERIRLILIDTPEMAQGEYGALAAEALAGLLPVGTAAPLELDVQERDRYGRILAYLYTPDGVMVNEELARLGYAVVAVFPPNVRHVERIRTAVEEARAARRGLWGGSAFQCEPGDHRAGRC